MRILRKIQLSSHCYSVFYKHSKKQNAASAIFVRLRDTPIRHELPQSIQPKNPSAYSLAQPKNCTRSRTCPSPYQGGTKKAALLLPIKVWCAREDSNLHDVTHWNLKPARLPIPPRAHVIGMGVLNHNHRPPARKKMNQVSLKSENGKFPCHSTPPAVVSSHAETIENTARYPPGRRNAHLRRSGR